MPAPPALPPITLLGFPFRSTGRGEHIRAVLRALTAAGVTATVYNLEPDAAVDDALLLQEIGPYLRETVPTGIRLFHLNGDEIPGYLTVFHDRGAGDFGAVTTSSFRRGNCRTTRRRGLAISSGSTKSGPHRASSTTPFEPR